MTKEKMFTLVGLVSSVMTVFLIVFAMNQPESLFMDGVTVGVSVTAIYGVVIATVLKIIDED